jgi:hypothetical protein
MFDVPGTNPVKLVADGYDRKARLYPSLLLVARVVVVGVAMRSAKLSVFESLGTAPVGFGGAFLLTQLARDAGKKGERNCSRSGRDAVSLYLPTP